MAFNDIGVNFARRNKGDPVYVLPAQLVHLLRTAHQVTVLTGAGISAESGIPTFREAQTGLWARYRPEDLATPSAFQRDPKLVWTWYQWRRDLVAGAEPNAGHYALAALEQRAPTFHLITQNVDGLHQLAGSGNRTPIIELHGNIHRTKCSDRGHPIDRWEDSMDIPPSCPQCGSLLRPDVVWFGEALPANALREALNAAENADLFMAIGTSGIVEPAASLPLVALSAGATLVEINPNETALTDHAHFILRKPSGAVLPRLVECAWGET